MSKALTTVQPQQKALTLSQDQVDLIKRTYARGATDDELKLFLYQCEKRGLDPLSRQIYFQKRKTKDGDQMTVLTAIDGYRLIADRTGKYAGCDDATFDDEAKPSKATVTVYKMVGGMRCAFTASARWDEYYPGSGKGFLWDKMPHTMLAKCAEALALRKAFPEELGGIYTPEEMDQAAKPDYDSSKTNVASTFDDGKEIYQGETIDQQNILKKIAAKHGVTKLNDLLALSKDCVGLEVVQLEAATKEWLVQQK